MSDNLAMEQDIYQARCLDDIRKNICEMIVEGKRGLFSVAYAENRPNWSNPGDYVEKALVLNVANQCDNVNGDLKRKLFDELKQLQIKQLFESKDFFNASQDHVPVLKACAVMETLAQIPGATSVDGFINSYFRILYELNFASNPDEMVGGASAGAKNVPKTAFITWRCVKAIKAFSIVFENTAICLDDLSRITSEKPEYIPYEWWVIDVNRAKLQAQITFEKMKDWNLFSSVDYSFAEESNKQLLNSLIKKLNESIETAERTIIESRTLSDDTDALLKGRDLLQLYIDSSKQAVSKIENLSDNPSGEEIRLISRSLEAISNSINDTLQPTKKFLAAVMDSELARNAFDQQRNCDAAELIFAADGYGRLNGWDDNRLQFTLEKALLLLTNNGRFPSHRPFDVADKGYVLHVSGAEVIKAVSNLILKLDYPTSVDTIQKLERHFVETWRKDGKGWRHERDHSKGNCYWWLSALSIQTLTCLNLSIDAEINRLVLKHVSTRPPSKLNTPLGALFYPDYGLVAANLRERSIAVDFQRLLAHVSGVTLPYEFLHSAILYGPPGTGKTTLAEALAKSAGLPLVEITPSDILLGGQEKVETQARFVFDGLSMLSNVVILFDEFDSILWHRSEEGTHQTIFQFLTPGMLPKIKNLYDRARKQHVAFILSTNLIGGLDDAAVREGRFDEKIGVFPPDALSRLGRLTMVLSSMGENLDNTKMERLEEVLAASAGRGMNRLAKQSWFTKTSNPSIRTPLAYIINGGPQPIWPPPEKVLSEKPYVRLEPNERMPRIHKSASEEQPSAEPKISSICLQEWNEWKWITAFDAYIQCHKSTSISKVIETWRAEKAKINEIDYIKWQEQCSKMFT